MFDKVERNFPNWLAPTAKKELTDEICQSILSEKKERVLKNPGSAIDYGYSFPGLTPAKQLCLESIREQFEKTHKRPLVADIGAGFGTMTWKLLAAGARVDAFEVQVPTAKELQKRLAHMNSSFWSGEALDSVLRVYANDVIKQLNSGDFEQRYDVIWCSQVLHFFTPEQMEQIIPLFNKILKPDGRIFIEANPVETFQFFDEYKLITTTVERAKKKRLSYPGFMVVNCANLVNDTFGGLVEAHIVTSVLDQDEMKKKNIPLVGTASGTPYLGHQGAHENERFFDSKVKKGYQYRVSRFYQVVNWMDDELAVQYFGSAGFETSCYYFGTDGESLYPKATISNKETYGIAVFLKKSPQLQLLDEKKDPRALQHLSIFKTTPHNYLAAEVKKFCGNEKKYESFIQAVEGKEYAVALRKACAIGCLPLVRALLKFSSQLKFDINQPSPSNGFTAFDWILSVKEKDCPEKSMIISILERYGALGKDALVQKVIPKH